MDRMIPLTTAGSISLSGHQEFSELEETTASVQGLSTANSTAKHDGYAMHQYTSNLSRQMSSSGIASFSLLLDRVPIALLQLKTDYEPSHAAGQSYSSDTTGSEVLASENNSTALYTSPNPLFARADHYEISLPNTLCGFPAFCSSATLRKCRNVTLWDCEECNLAGAVSFAVCVSLLGLAILLGNSFVVWCNLSKQKGFTGAYNSIKASLAFADLLTGFNIFFVTLYNFAWTMRGTATELDREQLALRGSLQAHMGGIFYLLSFTSSLYHLVFLGQQRLHAIRWPILYKAQRKRVSYVGIAVVWILSIISAVSPAWFQDVFTFTYLHTIFLYNATLKTITPNPVVTPLVLMVAFIFIIPFLAMTCCTIASVATIRSSAVLSRKLTQSKRLRNVEERISANEITIFRTLALMQLGFTITLVPVLVVSMLSYSGALDCNNISTPYLVSFYLSMSNSLVNVLVYSNVDPNFRSAVATAFSFCFSWKRQEKPNLLRTLSSPATDVYGQKRANLPVNRCSSASSSC